MTLIILFIIICHRTDPGDVDAAAIDAVIAAAMPANPISPIPRAPSSLTSLSGYSTKWFFDLAMMVLPGGARKRNIGSFSRGLDSG
jgi:hypothetical protein